MGFTGGASAIFTNQIMEEVSPPDSGNAFIVIFFVFLSFCKTTTTTAGGYFHLPSKPTKQNITVTFWFFRWMERQSRGTIFTSSCMFNLWKFFPHVKITEWSCLFGWWLRGKWSLPQSRWSVHRNTRIRKIWRDYCSRKSLTVLLLDSEISLLYLRVFLYTMTKFFSVR